MTKNGWIKTGLLILIVLAFFIGSAIFGGLWATRSVADVGNQFLSGLADQDYETAYALGGASLRQEIGDPGNLEQALVQQGLIVDEWRIRERSRNGDRGEIAGTVRFIDGRSGRFVVLLQRSEGRWLVTAFSLQPNG